MSKASRKSGRGREALAALSPAETEIARIVWQLGSGTVQDVCDALPGKRGIAYATVQTLLRRLEAKGYLTHSVRGKAHVFSPLAAKEKVVARTVGDFVDRLFGGDPVPLMLHLADHSELSPDDVRRLKQLIEKDKDRKPPRKGRTN